MRYDTTVCGIVLAMSLSTSSVNAAFYVHDAFGNLRTIDVSTREVQLVGSMGVVLTDIAFDPQGRLFGLSFSNFYEIDPTTAQVTLIGPHSIPCGNALEFKGDGTLYGVGCRGGSLFTIDTATGVGTPIGNIGYSAYGDLAFNNGRLYLAESGNRLVEIDLSNGAVASVVGPIGFSSVWGLDTDSNGTLFGFSGTNVLSIDTTTGAGTLVFDYRGPDVQQAFGASSTFTEPVSPIASPPPGIVYLLLHGTASSPNTWDALKADMFSDYCPITRVESDITEDSNCYRHEFEDWPLIGDDKWRNGDGRTFKKLGVEVKNIVKKIEAKVHPLAIILVGHSRGGLAARAYLQEITEPPAFKLGLLTIGTPHQGTPLGRAKHWLLNHGYLPKKVDWSAVFLSAEDVYRAKSILFSPSAGYQATAHNKNGRPVRQPISEAIRSLNDRADRLDDHVSTFGHIFSVELQLGEDAVSGIDFLRNPFGRLFPGNFKKLRRFVLRNVGRDNNGVLIGHGDNGSWSCTNTQGLNDWACNGDGIAPTISQRMTRIPGFSPGGKPFHPKLLQRVPHLGETGQTGAIKEVLDIMAKDLK